MCGYGEETCALSSSHSLGASSPFRRRRSARVAPSMSHLNYTCKHRRTGGADCYNGLQSGVRATRATALQKPHRRVTYTEPVCQKSKVPKCQFAESRWCRLPTFANVRCVAKPNINLPFSIHLRERAITAHLTLTSPAHARAILPAARVATRQKALSRRAISRNSRARAHHLPIVDGRDVGIRRCRESVNASGPLSFADRHNPAKQNQSSPRLVNFHFSFGTLSPRNS